MNVAAVLGGKEMALEVGEGAVVLDAMALLLDSHGEALAKLILQSRSPMGLAPGVKVYVNGRGIDFLGGLQTPLSEGDDLLIMPQLSGG
jgi:molybdopterin converting factor small subunit